MMTVDLKVFCDGTPDRHVCPHVRLWCLEFEGLGFECMCDDEHTYAYKL